MTRREVTQAQAARHVGRSYNVIKSWMERGWLAWRETPFGPLIRVRDVERVAAARAGHRKKRERKSATA